MTAIVSYPVVRAASQKREELSVHAVEKIRPKAEFNGEQNGRKEPRAWLCTPVSRPSSSQSETSESASFWDAPRLTPQFVAQVMGQVYCPKEPTASAQTAYRQPLVRKAVLLDENV